MSLQKDGIRAVMSETVERETLKKLSVRDTRTPEELKEDGDDRWPDGSEYQPPSAHDCGEDTCVCEDAQ